MQTISQLKTRGLEIWNHAGFQKYFRNTGWMFAGRFFTLGVSFFIGIYIARYLGPANYGLLSYVTSFVGLFGFLASLGIEGILNREIVKDHNKKDDLIGTAFYLKLAGSFLAITAVFLISILTTHDIFILGLIWIYSLVFIFQAFNVIEIYFQSQVMSKKVVTAQIIAYIVSACLKILVIIMNKGIFWLTLIFVVEAMLYAVILLFSFRKFGNHIRNWKFRLPIAKSILNDSWPLMLSAVAIGIYMKIDQVMIKNMLGNEQTGIYAVAVKLSEVWYFLPGIICTSLFPALVQSIKTDVGFFNQRIKKLYTLMFWLSFGIALVTTILAGPIIKILFGSQYIGSVIVLQIYVWAGISVSLSAVINQYLIVANYTKISFFNTMTGAILNIIINLLLLPKMGIKGAAIATLTSYTIVILSLLIYKKTRKHGIIIFKSILNLH